MVFGAIEYAQGGLPFIVVGDNPSSMSKTMNYGDLAVTTVVPFGSLKVGDIIVFHDPRGNPAVITHRIVGIAPCGSGECLSTKGDNNATNPSPDPWNVTQSDYIAKVVLIVPYIGYASPSLWGFRGVFALLPLSIVLLFGGIIYLVKSWHLKPKKLNMALRSGEGW